MKNILYIILLLGYNLQAQAPPQVLNAAGTTVKVNGNYYGYNIGEPIAGTGHNGNGNPYYTQGFLQPDYKVGTAFGASLFVGGENCQGAGDGYVVINPFNNNGPVSYAISPSPSPADTGSTITNLAPGNYTVTITDSAGNHVTRSLTVPASTKACEDTVYHAFSPNDDGLNDLFMIPGIQRFSENHVYFFNRWGQLVWDNANYDNVKVVWDGKDKQGVALTSGTYYYIIERKGSKVQKSWVEITR